MKKIVNVDAEFTAFDYDKETNNLRLTFDLKNEETRKFIKSKIALGSICRMEIETDKII